MIVKTENLSREFVRGKNQFYAVDHVNLEVEEKELVAAGGGSRDWTAAEREVILSTKNNRQLSSVMSEMGYTGHHINSVKGNGVLGGKWQGDPRNIVFLQNANHPSGYDEHLHGLQGHRGSYDTPGKGRLIDRNLTRKNLKSCQ